MNNSFRIANGVCVDDLLKPSKDALLQNAEDASNGCSITEYVWSEDGQPPIISWNSAFDKLIDKRIKAADAMADNGICLWPWRIFEALPENRKVSDILDWNQGPIPSCAMHSAAHSYQFTTLVEMGMGAPIVYDAVNPIYPFWIARGGNLAGGLTLIQSAKQVNEGGHFAVFDVGADNRGVERGDHFCEWEKNAEKRQSAIVYLEDELVERIFRAAHAGFFVSFGSNTIYSGSDEDANGVKIASRVTHGGHAQCLGAWRKVKGTEYVWIQNSHGDRYGQSEEGEPKTGAWCRKEEVELLTRDMKNFGLPWVGIPEDPNLTESSLMNEWRAEFPRNFRK